MQIIDLLKSSASQQKDISALKIRLRTETLRSIGGVYKGKKDDGYSDTDDDGVTGAYLSADLERAQPGPDAGVLEQRIVSQLVAKLVDTSGVDSSQFKTEGGTAKPISSTVLEIYRRVRRSICG
ncbi:hypothetical protein EVAR_79572_1 [Eumeta japonica]|uniref:Uncharacterized protein n=1 Tax=Eumeta variegata TaxID=151549 RepID=A0A4C1UE61_EUMVA|nr:hypothetical protein EVAR_79572_1 [Eumeta japonica]